MMIGEGSRVRLIYTDDVGKIIRIDGDVAQVELSDGDVIPCPLENLESATAVTPKPSNEWQLNGEKSWLLSKSTKVDKGVLMAAAFDENDPQNFELFLINNTNHAALFSFQIKSKIKQKGKLNGKIGAMMVYHLDKIGFPWLGEGTKAYFEFWPVLQNGTGKKLDPVVNIKVPQFFENHQSHPEVHPQPLKLFPVLIKWVAEQSEMRKESLQAYTKEKMRWREWEGIMDNHEVEAKAAFNHELDLHVESLTELFDKLGNLEILKLQIKHFERYMSEAIKVNADRVFIIHGIGKGKLRQEISTRLARYPQVASYINEYHPRYGWGATEVVFK